MDKKQFNKELLIRTIPFIATMILTVVLAIAGVAESMGIGFTAVIVAGIATLYFPLKLITKNLPALMNEQRKRLVATDFINGWNSGDYVESSVLGHGYVGHADDISLMFRTDCMEARKILRSEDGDVTGETEIKEVPYQEIEGCDIVGFDSEEGICLLEIALVSGVRYTIYFDCDLVRFLEEKTGKTVRNVDRTLAYYTDLMSKGR